MDSEQYRKKYMRVCSICGEEKPIEQFSKKNRNICKQCEWKIENEKICNNNKVCDTCPNMEKCFDKVLKECEYYE